jgi:hypothetical protein
MDYYFTALFVAIILLFCLFASNLNRDARIDKIFEDIHEERVALGLED